MSDKLSMAGVRTKIMEDVKKYGVSEVIVFSLPPKVACDIINNTPNMSKLENGSIKVMISRCSS